MTKTEDWTT